jgi:hypothetical protein
MSHSLNEGEGFRKLWSCLMAMVIMASILPGALKAEEQRVCFDDRYCVSDELAPACCYPSDACCVPGVKCGSRP